MAAFDGYSPEVTIPAIGFREFGGPDVLDIVEIPVVRPGPGEVKVRVGAAGVNPTDTLFRAGKLPITEWDWPLVPGMDFAGVISEVGDSAGWAVGDQVSGVVMPWTDPTRAAYASEVVVAADSIVPSPRGHTTAASAAYLMNALTALQAIDLLALPDGATIGVTGGAGGVGGFAIGIARERGLRVIADARHEDRDLVLSLGAHEVVERGAGVVQRLSEASGGGLDGVVDAALIGPSLADAVRDGGGFASVRPATWTLSRGVTRHDVAAPSYFHSSTRLRELRAMVENGTLALRVAATYPADQAATAHRALERGGHKGRLVLEWR